MVREWLSQLGARLGIWNDNKADDVGYGGWWKRVDRVAGYLYTLPDRRGNG